MADKSAFEPTTTSQSFHPVYHDPVHQLSQDHISPQSVLDPPPAAFNRALVIQLRAAVAADADKHRLDQEAFAADPASMRKQFPTLLKDMVDNYPGERIYDHLNEAQISAGLKNTNLSDADRDLLSVFEAGFSVLARNPRSGVGDDNRPDDDPLGISADTLALVDKAVNRGLDEDPYFREHLIAEPIAGAAKAAATSALATYIVTRSGRASAIAGGLAAVGGLVSGAINPLVFKYGDGETKMYDQVKEDFLSFTNVFDESLVKPLP